MSETTTGNYLSFIQRKYLFLVITALLLILVAGIAVTIGSYDMTIADVYRIIAEGILHPGNTTAYLVVWNIRLPRILLGILAGAGLGICGAVLQAILRNPLASPFTLGITSAATFGASLAMILGIGILGGSSFVIINAFIFTLIASFAIYALAFTKKFSPGAIIMAGIAISYLFGALTSFLQYVGTADAVQQVVFWTLGSLGRANWFSIQVVAGILVITVPILLWYSMDLNVMGSGDEAAKSMGVDVSRIRIVTLVLTSLLIGLVGPHICRMIVGPDHRFLLPASALMGALILVCADIAARTLFAPQVIPIGIMTSFIGVPFFIYLFVKRRGMYW